MSSAAVVRVVAGEDGSAVLAASAGVVGAGTAFEDGMGPDDRHGGPFGELRLARKRPDQCASGGRSGGMAEGVRGATP